MAISVGFCRVMSDLGQDFFCQSFSKICSFLGCDLEEQIDYVGYDLNSAILPDYSSCATW